jgi:hypothetical protein
VKKSRTLSKWNQRRALRLEPVKRTPGVDTSKGGMPWPPPKRVRRA